MRELIDMTGQKFGKLTVIKKGKYYVYASGKRRIARWKVKCDCGNVYEIRRQNLLKSRVCPRCSKGYINLTGRYFGKLKVIKEDDNEYRTPKGIKYIKWICRCDCGTIASVLGDHLKAGHTTRCLQCKYKSMQLNGYISSRLLSNIKYGAKKRNIYFDPTINREYLWELYLKQNKKCALSNLQIHFSKNAKQEISHRGTTASLDRIDSSMGYTKDNIQWVHKDVNKMKLDHNQKYFIKLCSLISENKK